MSKGQDYIFNNIRSITVRGKNETLVLEMPVFKKALKVTNDDINTINDKVPYLFEILGMRNLSSFIGELFVRALEKCSDGKLIKNPHQDGYPDILIMTNEGKSLWDKLKGKYQDKSPFSNFDTGGIEVKATCGSVPTPQNFRKQGLQKPEIGDERIDHAKSYDWKAHHRETNNLVGIYWDFVSGKPIICGLFFSGDLLEDDWGKIVQPKAGGGRTTSVSIMGRDGIYKMYENWIAVIDDKRYADFFDNFNQSDLIGDFFDQQYHP